MGVRISPVWARLSVAKMAVTFLVTIFAGITFWLHPASRAVQAPLEVFLAWTTGHFLALFDASVVVTNTSISMSSFAANIVPACTGLFTMTIYTAAVLAYPCSWKRKLQGVLVGVLAILALNWVRIVSLMLIGAYWETAFDFAHLVVWQSAAIVFAVFVWLFWIQRWAHEK